MLEQLQYQLDCLNVYGNNTDGEFSYIRDTFLDSETNYVNELLKKKNIESIYNNLMKCQLIY